MLVMKEPMSWAEYRESHWVTDADEPAAFAAYMNSLSGGALGSAAPSRIGGDDSPAHDSGNGTMHDADPV